MTGKCLFTLCLFGTHHPLYLLASLSLCFLTWNLAAPMAEFTHGMRDWFPGRPFPIVFTQLP